MIASCPLKEMENLLKVEEQLKTKKVMILFAPEIAIAK